MTDKEKIQRMIRWLTESHLHAHGGYPYDYAVRDGLLYVAELDDSKCRERTELTVYRLDRLVLWYDAATDMLSTDEDGNACELPKWDDEAHFLPWENHIPDENGGEDHMTWWEAFYETQPDDIAVTDGFTDIFPWADA